jgi:hypothetical protein
MSYLFSEAKNSHTGESAVPNVRSSSSDLNLRARLILTWMLLVELLRKKVEAILVTAGVQAYSSIISHATSVAWLGNLVFFNLKGVGQKAVFGILWLLCAVKAVQRAAIAEFAKRSFAYGKNARLLSSYMAQLPQWQEQDVQANGSEKLKMCKYVVMGEESLVLKAACPHGYQLDLNKINTDDANRDNDVVTVGRIWRLLEPAKEHRRLCFSFALFKLFRRRFEHLPAMSKEETSNCRDLIFKGLCQEEGVNDHEVALFRVINDEVNFLSEYYHSVLPVVLASPYFFLVNYFVVPIIVFQLCLMIVALCGDGNIFFAFHRIGADNFALSSGIITLTKCLWKRFWSSASGFSSTTDISISYLLFFAFIYEEVWEFIILVLSNWFMVSLLCTYTARLRWRQSPTISGAIRCISWVRKKLRHSRIITMKQFSVLRFSWLSITLPVGALPKQAKSSIVGRLRLAAYGQDNRAIPLSNGRSVLNGNYSHLSWFCKSDSIAEVILIWHIATTLLETALPHQNRGVSGPDHKKVATGLSKYCAYIVAFKPELLPDDREGTERVYKDMKKDLKKALGCRGYYFSLKSARYHKLITLNPNKFKPNCRDEAMTVIEKGIVLMEELKHEVNKGNEGPVWQLLAELWVELVVYIAPPGGDEHLIGHEQALVQPGELLTLLWVLATHTGITRPPPPASLVIEPVVNVEEGTSKMV